MRHFFYLASPPGALARGVPRGAAVAALVVRCGATQRVASAHRRTRPGTVHIATVTGSANVHRLAAGGAVVEPMGLPIGFIGRHHAPIHEELDNAVHRMHKGDAQAFSREPRR